MMRTVFTIGEALIDFVPTEMNCPLKDVSAFSRAAGGAPANVACAVAKLGGRSAFIGKLGEDAFGDHIVEALSEVGVDTSYVFRTSEANTALAFISLQEDGQREFSFYRKPSADMLLSSAEIKLEWFQRNDILHFGSVSLIDDPAKDAHELAIQYCRKQGGIISFDPNVRPSLWKNEQELRETIQSFLPLADIVKVSSDELYFLTEISNEELALQSLFKGAVKHILYTRGAEGAEWIAPSYRVYVPSLIVNAVDTTGAGDAFIGAILYQLAKEEVPLEAIQVTRAADYLKFATTAAGLTTENYGAIPALVTEQQVLKYLGK
jgi:fructokinase